MPKQKLALEIWDECCDLDGFIVKLRTQSFFDEARYRQLIGMLRAYNNMTATDEAISRHVVATGLNLIKALSLSLSYAQNYSNHIQNQLEHAYTEATELLDELVKPRDSINA